ncbi:hypothetical protein [Glutamicibacter sp.]|uniref:hypothetical protein n=1 Tax=Glutamicibacter sp. TaxID=1931995 RepID=UPI0028BECFCF|nr:hypothetical protein [Glutamicibacter sp.]
MSENQEERELAGPPQKLDPIRDMEPIRLGDITSFHRGLHAQIAFANQATVYGQITFVHHREMSSKIAVNWQGLQNERIGHPEQIIRIEATP